MSNIERDSLVRFKRVLNARGYPATGSVIEVKDGLAKIEVFGLHGPGSTTMVHDVPVDDIETLD